MDRIGEIAAFGTAICWTTSALFFERATRRIGVLNVNFFKVTIAFFLLTATAGIARGMPLPLDAPRDAWLFLSLSSLFGFVLADMFLFTAYKTIGSRVTTLFLALSPPMTAGFGYLLLGESLGSRGWGGMALVMAGIVIAVAARRDPKAGRMSREDKKGYLFALVASIGQSIGIVFSRRGVAHYDAVSASQIRVFFAIIGFGAIAMIRDRGRGVAAAVKDRVAMKPVLAGAVFGPYIGVALSLFAAQKTYAGVVSTLIGLTPVLIIPPSIVLLKQKVRPLEIAGAAIAVAGSALFFM